MSIGERVKRAFDKARRPNDDPVPDLDQLASEVLTPPERAADWSARLIGTWKFIIVELALTVVWILANSRHGTTFDAFPFPLLGGLLTLVAAIATPLILMSQNRQAVTDRLAAEAARTYALETLAIARAISPKLDELATLVKNR